MRAIEGHTYSIIKGAAVHSTFDKDKLPEWCDISENPEWPYSIHVVDITGVEPSPQSGWLYDGATFTPPPTPPPHVPTQDEIDRAEARQHAKLTALRNMTPAQVQAWVDANVTNFAEAKDALKTLAVAVSILARRL